MTRPCTLADLVQARFLRACAAVSYRRSTPTNPAREWRTLEVLLAGEHIGWIIRHYSGDFYLASTAPTEADGIPGDLRDVWKLHPYTRLWPDPDPRTGRHDPADVLAALIALDPSIDLPEPLP